MDNFINISRFVDNKSYLCNINPLIKLFVILTSIVIVSINPTIVSISFFFLFFMITLVLSKINILYFIKAAKFILFFIMLFFLMGLVNKVSIEYYIKLSLRIYATFGLIVIFSMTTDNDIFASQLSKLISLFITGRKRDQLVFNIIFIGNIVPELMNTVREIYVSQKVRGIKFHIFNIVGLIIPLIMQVDIIATSLSESYHARKLSTSHFIVKEKFIFTYKEIIYIILMVSILIIGNIKP